MRKAYGLVLFLLFAGFGRAQFYVPDSAFGIVAPAGGNADPALEKTASVARLRHKLVGKAVAAFARAARFANEGAWQKGALELQKAIAIDPEFSEAHGNLGADYALLGRFEDAAAELRDAIRLDPADGSHHSNLAITLILLGSLNEAELEARSAVANDATNFKAHYVLGILLARKPELRSEAIPHLVYAARFLAEGHQALAEVYGASGQPDLARKELERYRAALSKQAPRH